MKAIQVVSLLSYVISTSAQTPVFGDVGNFAILGQSIDSIGSEQAGYDIVTGGNLGYISVVEGFGPPAPQQTVTGKIKSPWKIVGGDTAESAIDDAEAAFADIMARPNGEKYWSYIDNRWDVVHDEIPGLVPGTYDLGYWSGVGGWGERDIVEILGLLLDAKGNKDASWYFRVTTGLRIFSSTKFEFVGGVGNPQNVWFAITTEEDPTIFGSAAINESLSEPGSRPGNGSHPSSLGNRTVSDAANPRPRLARRNSPEDLIIERGADVFGNFLVRNRIVLGSKALVRGLVVSMSGSVTLAGATVRGYQAKEDPPARGGIQVLTVTRTVGADYFQVRTKTKTQWVTSYANGGLPAPAPTVPTGPQYGGGGSWGPPPPPPGGDDGDWEDWEVEPNA